MLEHIYISDADLFLILQELYKALPQWTFDKGELYK